jgi:hypothetical protein
MKPRHAATLLRHKAKFVLESLQQQRDVMVRVVKIVLGVVAVVELFLWLPFYLAKPVIAVPQRYSHPLAAQPPLFSVENRGILSAYSVKAICYGFNMELTDAAHKSHITVHDYELGTFAIADTLSNGPSFNFSIPMAHAVALGSDIQVLVTFRPEFAWGQSVVCGRFKIMPDANQQPTWFEIEPANCKKLWKCLSRQTQVDDDYRVAMHGWMHRLIECHCFPPNRPVPPEHRDCSKEVSEK